MASEAPDESVLARQPEPLDVVLRRARHDPGQPPTNFEAAGHCDGYIDLPGRKLLLTIDLDAFGRTDLSLWTAAMRRWAARAADHGLPFSMFVSVEDAAQARASGGIAYDAFLDAVRALAETGSRFYPHSHCVFDPADGHRLTESGPSGAPVAGYRRQPSMFYDAVRREGLDLGEWLVTVAQTYERLLDDAGVAPPQWQTFRPGSWDSGSSPSDLEQYIDALVSNRMTFTSGAASGIFGTPSERIGANYGDNVFRLSKGPIEVAPCVFLDCGAPLGSRSWAGAARRMLGQAGAFAREEGGALVTVLHLDHLFHVRERGVYRYFVVDDEAVVEARVDRFFRYLAACRRLMGVEPITFEELPETFAR